MIYPLKIYSKFSDWYKEGGNAYSASPHLSAGSRVEWVYKIRLKCKSPGVSTTPIHSLTIL